MTSSAVRAVPDTYLRWGNPVTSRGGRFMVTEQTQLGSKPNTARAKASGHGNRNLTPDTDAPTGPER